jgi:phosphatidylinositol alpha 1,6-mannosyltransferase
MVGESPNSMPLPRILYCTDTYPPQVNGVSVVTALSVAGLAARGWEVAVVAPAYPGAGSDPFRSDASSPTVEVLHIPSVSLPLYPDVRLAAPNYRAIRAAVAVFDPDLVHSETEFVIGRLGQVAGNRAGIPLASSYHTDFSRYAAAYGMSALRGTITGYLGRFHRRSVRTYTPSAAAKADLVRLGVRNVEVWGRGVDATTFHPTRRSAPLRDAYGQRDTMLFLHVGRLAREKGVERILEAYRLAAAQLPAGRAHLIIAGAGPQEVELRAHAPPGVTFLGNLDRATVLPRLYASCDAFVFASLTETLGLVVLEAMASGLPVVACPAGGVADHLRDDENGIACAPGDPSAMARAMVTLAFDRDRCRRLAAGARATAEALSWDNELDRLDSSYRELIEIGRPAKLPPRPGALAYSA